MARLSGVLNLGRGTGWVAVWAFLGLPLVPQSAGAATIRVSDLDYIHRTYFFIADHPIVWNRSSLFVWRDDGYGFDNTPVTLPGKARLDPTALPNSSQNPEYLGRFDILTGGVDYNLIFPYPPSAPAGAVIPVIELAAPLPPDAVLGISFVETVGEDTVAVGNSDPWASDSTLGKNSGEVLLKLIGPNNDFVPTASAGVFDPAAPWYPGLRYELRNFYRLGVRNFSREDLTVRVRHRDPAFPTDPDALGGVPFISLLGLDQHGPFVGSPPDGKVDDQYLDWDRGILFFPDLHPFDPDTTAGSCLAGTAGLLCLDNIGRNPLRDCDDSGACIANPAVYHTKYPDALNQTRFYLEVILREPLAPRALRQNRPNPFRSGTTIEFVSDAGFVRVFVHDIHGRLVKVLLRGALPAGSQTLTWDGTDASGHRVSAGVYVCRLEGNGFNMSRRMVLLH